jgi:predicted glycogen debranching enzyme
MPEYLIETHGELFPGISQEWLLTNGRGSFSSGTVVGCNTRRYHALLLAATLPPVGRMAMLNEIGELLTINQETHEFWINQFGPDKFHPRGERYLRRFELGDGEARWHYDVAGVRVTKRVTLLWKRDLVGIRYEIDPRGAGQVRLELLPMVTIRDFHSLQRGTDKRYETARDGQRVAIKSGQHTLHLLCDNDSATWRDQPDRWKGHFYAIEHERGQDDTEDLYTPGRFVIGTNQPTIVTIWAGTDPVGITGFQPVFEKHGLETRDTPERSPSITRLLRAANDFVVERKCPDGSPGVTVIAGYPWFADWGRDTMISLPGLFLVPGRLKEAAQVLSLFAKYVSEGMIPNKFDDYTNQPQYNTVDASLWFIHSCFEYLKASKDAHTFDRTLFPACRAIIDGYTRGTRFNIRMDERDGLITQGDASTQLTWMDAKCNGVAFTPRQGKAVEINALWYNALRLMKLDERARQVEQSFQKCFWISPFRGLCDVVDGDRRDSSIRPNQIFGVSLPHSPLSREQQHAVVEVVRRELLTPYGLRTLAPSDPNFHSYYTGPQFQRDGAYHNGTIWPWLIGGFLEAYLKVNDRSKGSVEQARAWLTPLVESMQTQGCIGSIPEIFEAEPPHRPVGCPAQAWSVAEVLRLAGELEM